MNIANKQDLSQDASINWEFLDESSSQREQIVGINSSHRFNKNFQNQSIQQLIGQDLNISNLNNMGRHQQNQSYFAQNDNGQKYMMRQDKQELLQSQSQGNLKLELSGNTDIKFSQTPGIRNRQVEHLKTFKKNQLNSSQALSGNIINPIDDSANISQRSRQGKSPLDKKQYNASSLMDKKKTLKNTQTSTNSFINSNQHKLALRLKRPKQKFRHFTQVVMNLTYVTQFIQIMKDLIFGQLQVKKLQDIEIDALNDLAHSQEQFKASAKMKELMRTKILKQDQQYVKDFFKQCFVKLITFVPIIRPYLRSKMFFDCYFGYLVLFRMYFTTIKYVFFLTDIRGSVNIIKGYTIFIINISFLIDIFISFHTGYYENGLLIMDRKKIAQRYLKSSFFSDLLVQIPMLFQMGITDQSSFNVILIGYLMESLIFLKIFGLNALVKRAERVISESEIGAAWWPLLSLIVKILILAHFLGCFYFLVGVYQIEYLQDDRNWIQIMEPNFFGDKALYEQGWFLQYLVAIFWSLGIMIQSVLEIPQTKIELIFTCFFVVIMTGTLGYVISTIGQILDNIEKKNKKYRLERERTFRFLNKKEIPEKLKERVTLYLDYVHEYEKQRNLEEEKLVLDRMPKQLQRDLLFEVNKGKINFFQALSEHFDEQTLRELTLEIKSQMFATGDIIFNEGQTIEDDEFSIYVCSKGKVQMFYQFPNGDTSVIGYKEEGNMFGEIEFFTGQPRQWGIKAVQPSSILSIKRSRFVEIVSRLSQDKERFCFIKDKLIQNKTSIEFPQLCTLCQNVGHFPKYCPNTHLQIELKQMIYDYNTYDLQINRQVFDRIQLKSHNALLDYDDIQNCVQEIFEQDYDEYLKDEALRLQEMYTQLNDDYDEVEFSIHNSLPKQDIKRERKGSKQHTNLVQNLFPDSSQSNQRDHINIAQSSYNQLEKLQEKKLSYHKNIQGGGGFDDEHSKDRRTSLRSDQQKKLNIQINNMDNQNLSTFSEQYKDKSKIITEQKELIKNLQNLIGKQNKGQDNMTRLSNINGQNFMVASNYNQAQIRHSYFNSQRQSNNISLSNELDQSNKLMCQSKEKQEKNQNPHIVKARLHQQNLDQKQRLQANDIFKYFDKIQEFEIYYTQFNYSQISKQENLKKIFQADTVQTEEENPYSQTPSNLNMTNKLSKRSVKIAMRQETGSSRYMQESALQNQRQSDATKMSFSPLKQIYDKNKFQQINLKHGKSLRSPVKEQSRLQDQSINQARFGKSKTFKRAPSGSPDRKLDFQFKDESDSDEIQDKFADKAK